ncbi:alpha/beta hydrolase [Rosenbergiella epipactidis]|uniref:alpha/beta hydrolase n=1 Tax=Rosenbergiella epipactidis TaxID=1544694 RepID=UPI002026CD06|nr:alpha/beta hydrolase [Rosenbergiella epipactidis]MCL9668592.1 alpha/beta hydrolase [Rosenbergiella epipactidis]
MKKRLFIALGSKGLGLLAMSFMLSGCQSLAISLTHGAMENETTKKNVQALAYYADKNIKNDLRITADYRYGELPSSRMDIVTPSSRPGQHYPVIVLVHGGGWVAGNKESTLAYARLLADQGFAVVNIEYSLVPTQAFPTQLKQLNQALQALSTLHDWPLDLNHLFLSGDSAGANIVSNYAALLNSPLLQQQLAMTPAIQPQQLKGLVVHSGVYDIASLYQSGQKLPWTTRWIMQEVLGAYSGEKPPSLRKLYAMSATPWLTTHYPPVWISASDNDLLTQGQSRLFIERLTTLNVPVEAHIYPKQWPEPLNHDFEFSMQYRASQQVFESSVDFIRRYSDR